MSELAFTVFGEPVPKGRPRVGLGGRVYTPARTRDAEEDVRIAALTATTGKSWLLVPEYRYALVMEFYCASARRVDIDNLAKLCADSCNGVLWLDDSQIVHWVARKRIDKDNPRTEVCVRLVEDGDG